MNPIDRAVEKIHYRFTSGSQASPAFVALEKGEIREAIIEAIRELRKQAVTTRPAEVEK